MFKKYTSFMLIFTILLLSNCNTENTDSSDPAVSDPTTTEEAPTLPPENAMLDLSALYTGFTSSIKQDLSSNALVRLGEQWHFNVASGIVFVWSAFAALVMSVPAVSFRYVISQTPTKEADNIWAWNAKATVLGVDYTGKLTGEKMVNENKVKWIMKISKSQTDASGCCNDFMWFDGECDFGALSGNWQIYDPTSPDSLKNKFKIDWSVSSTVKFSLKLTHNDETISSTANLGNGSYVEYQLEGTKVTFTAKNSINDNPTVISWDTVTKDGSILYNDGVTKNCWDSSKNTITCP